MDPRIRDEVVEFLRGWLPETAREAYLRMMERDPEGWHRHPHFAGGVIVRHALRGNGFTEELLGVSSLEPYWPGLLASAVGAGALPPPAEAARTPGRAGRPGPRSP